MAVIGLGECGAPASDGKHCELHEGHSGEHDTSMLDHESELFTEPATPLEHGECLDSGCIHFKMQHIAKTGSDPAVPDATRLRDLRTKMDVAIREFADALWEENGSEQHVLGDMLVVCNFTPLDRVQYNTLGEVEPSHQYTIIQPRPLPAHAVEGLLSRALHEVDVMREIQDMVYYPEDHDGDE